MDPIAQLKIGLSEVELIKEQFNREQRHLLIGGRESSWADLDDDQSDGIGMEKRKSQNPAADRGGKKIKCGATSAVNNDDLLIHPNVKSLFVKMKQQYRQLEYSTLVCIANEKNEQQLQELQNFLLKIVQSSWVVLLHVSPILNAAVVSKPDVVICALAGYESRILGITKKNFIGKEIFVPTCTVSGHLVKEDHARKIPTNGLSTTEIQQSKFHLEYATKADGKQERGPPVPIIWIDENQMDTTGLSGIFMARLFNINPKRGENGIAQRQAVWVDGYQVAFFAKIHSVNKGELLGLTLPFEIVSNYSKQKEAKWGETLWRLAVCTEDKFFTTQPKETVEIDVVVLLQEMNKWLKGYVGTDVGLNTVHMLNLRRLLAQEWGCYNGNVDYSKFGTMWSYFFKAAEFIKKNRETLWDTNLMNYCFTSAIEAEALLSQKSVYTLLIRFQLTAAQKGIPSISLIVPGDEIGPSYIAHIGVQNLIGKDSKVYDLPHILKYSMLYYITKTNGGDQLKYMDWFDFTHFEVYGRGKTDVTQYAVDDPQAIATMMTTEIGNNPNAPLAGYAGKRKVTNLIQVVPLEPKMVEMRFKQILSSPLGTVLSSNGTRKNLEWPAHEIQYLDMQNLGTDPEVTNQRQTREATSRVIEQESSEQHQDVPMHQIESKDQFPGSHGGSHAQAAHGNQQLQAVIQPQQQRPNPVEQQISSHGYTKTLSPVNVEMMQAIVKEKSTNFVPQIQQETAFGMPQQPIQQCQIQQGMQNVPGGGRMTVSNTNGYTNYIVVPDQPVQAQVDAIMRQSPGMFANQQFSPNSFPNPAQSPQQTAAIGNSPSALPNQNMGSPAMYQNYQGSPSPAGYQSPNHQDTAYKSPEPQYQPISHAFTHFQQVAQQQYGAQHTPQGIMHGQQQCQQSVYNNVSMSGYTYNQSSMHGQQSGYGRPVSTEGMQQQFAPCSRPYDQGMHQPHAASSNQLYFMGFDGAHATDRFPSPNIHNQQHFRQAAQSGAYGQVAGQFQQNAAAPVMQNLPNADMMRANMAGDNVGKTEREKELEEQVRMLTEQLKLIKQ